MRVATYNLYLGADLTLVLGESGPGRGPEELATNLAVVRDQLAVTAFPRRAPAVARLLARERPDLVGLQEVCTWTADGVALWDAGAELLDALEAAGEPYDLVVTQPSFAGTGPVSFPTSSVQQLRLGGSNAILRRQRSAVRVEQTTMGHFASAMSTLLLGTTPVSITRGWCAARCRVPDERTGAEVAFTFVDTHTEANDETARHSQHEELTAALPETGPAVVVGDLNATPDRVRMPPGFVDAWAAMGGAHSGPDAATGVQAADLRNAVPRLHERIDYVWVRGMRVRGCGRFGADPADRTADGLWPSDHAGVIADLEPLDPGRTDGTRCP